MGVSMCNHNTYTLRQARSLFKKKKKYHDVFKVLNFKQNFSFRDWFSGPRCLVLNCLANHGDKSN